MENSEPNSELIISTFYQSNDSITPEEAFEVKQLLLSVSDTVLFSKRRLDTLNEDFKLFPYLCALFASNTDADDLGSRRRLNCFYHAVYYIKKGGAIDTQRNNCIERLSANIRYLPEKGALGVILNILDNFNPTDESSPFGHIALVELIPSLYSQCSLSGKASIAEKILDMSWPARCIPIFSTVIVELSESVEQCNEALERISSHIGWSQPSISRLLKTSINLVGSSTDSVYAEIDDLPLLFYQLTLLGKKYVSNSSILLRILCIIGCSLDTIINALINEDVSHGANKGSSISSNSSRYFTVVALMETYPILKRAIHDVLANILHHLTLVLSRDHALVAEVLHLIKNRWLATMKSKNSAIAIGDNMSISCGRLLLCLLACQSTQHKDKIIQQLKEFVVEIFSVEHNISTSLWYQDKVWQSAMKIQSSHLFRAMEILTSDTLLVDQTITPLLQLAFALIDIAKPAVDMIARDVSSNSIGDDSEGDPIVRIGMNLILRLHSKAAFLRGHIVKEISSRILLCSMSGVDGTQNANSNATTTITADLVARICIQLLTNLSHTNPLLLLDCCSDLHELFSSLVYFPCETASKLIDAMAPIMAYSPSLGEKCSLALRKASFCREAPCRQTAVSALVALLKYQLIREYEAENIATAAASVSAGNCSTVSLNVDEILSLLRRFLRHQLVVRSTFYEKICDLGVIFPKFCPLGIRLLTGHIGDYLEGKHNSDMPYFQFDIMACLDMSGKFVENINDLMLSVTALLTSIPQLSSSIESTVQISYDAFELSQLSQPMTQINNNSSSLGTQPESLESKRANRQIWKMVKCACELSIAEYGLDEELADPPIVAKEYCKAEMLNQYFHCCMVHAMVAEGADGIGGATTVDRLEKLLNLAAKCEILCEFMNTQALKIKKSEQQGRKRMKASTEGDALLDSDLTTNTNSSFQSAAHVLAANNSVFSWHNWSHHLLLPTNNHSTMPTLLISCELTCLINSFECLFDSRLGIEMVDSTMPSQPQSFTQTAGKRPRTVDIDAEAPMLFKYPYLHRYLLHGSVYAFQCIMSMVQQFENSVAVPTTLINSNEYNSSISVDTPKNDEIEFRILLQLSSLCKSLFSFLLLDLIQMRKFPDIDYDYCLQQKTTSAAAAASAVGGESKKRGRQPLANSNQTSYTGQRMVSATTPRLLLRCLSDCISTVQAIEFRLQRLFNIPKFSQYGVGRSVKQAISEMLTTAFAKAGSTNGNDTMDANEAIIQSVKHLFRVMLSMQQSDDQVANPWRFECSTVLEIVAKLLKVLPSIERGRVSQRIFTECETKIFAPNNEFTHSLIHFFVVVIPCNSMERLQRVHDIAKLIEACNEDEAKGVDAGDEMQGQAVKTFTVLSRETLVTATIGLVAILEKSLIETSALLKLRERGSSQKIRAAQKMTADITDNDSIEERGMSMTGAITGDFYTQDEGRSRGSDGIIADACTEMECITIKRIFESAIALISTGIVVETAVDKLISLFSKIYKIQVKLTKSLVQDGCKVLPRMYRLLAEYTANTAHKLLQDYITTIHSSTAKRDKQAKIIPELVFQMEQLDVLLIKLSNSVLEKEIVRKLIKRSAARDFKFELNR